MRLTIYVGADLKPACSCFATMSKGKPRRRRRKVRGAPEFIRHLDKVSAVPAAKVSKVFRSWGKKLAEELGRKFHVGKLLKGGEVTEAMIDKAIADLDLSDMDEEIMQALRDVIRAELETTAAAAADNVGVELTPDQLTQLSDFSLAWARTRAAELVGKRVLPDGSVVDNPNASWQISDATREALRSTLADALEEGMSMPQLEAAIIESYGFSDARAYTIARTEMAFAHNSGNIAGWKASGVVEMKESILGSEHDIDDECNDAADQGPIPLDAAFDNGDDAPPFHPNCVCTVIPVTGNAGQDNEEETT